MTILVVALPFAVWGALPLGEESQENGTSRNLDPVALPAGLKGGLAVVAGAAVLVAVAMLLSPSGRASTRGSDVLVALPLLAAGGYAALTYNVMTQPVNGANIGGGVMMLFGFLFVPSMVVTSMVLALVARRDRRVR